MFVNFWMLVLLIKCFSFAGPLFGAEQDAFADEAAADGSGAAEAENEGEGLEEDPVANLPPPSFADSPTSKDIPDLTTKVPDRLTKCYGLVPSHEAANHLFLRNRDNKCDARGYVFLPEPECVAIRRGYKGTTFPLFGCPSTYCEDDISDEQCDVDRPRLKRALQRATDSSIVRRKKVNNFVYKGTAFRRAHQENPPILVDY